MMKLTEADLNLLKHLKEEGWRGFGARPSRTPQRDRLKRLGLIASHYRPACARGIAGQGKHWRLTAAGRAALQGERNA